MKTLVLIRHGKASPKGIQPDFARTLTTKGKKQAVFMADRMTEEGIVPDLVISSPAERAIATARELCARWGFSPGTILTDAELYEGGVDGYETVIRDLPEERACVALVAHNPEIGYLAGKYSSGQITDFPTCSAAAFRVDIDRWKTFPESLKSLLLFASPVV